MRHIRHEVSSYLLEMVDRRDVIEHDHSPPIARHISQGCALQANRAISQTSQH